ncbi:unnamed protein product [Calypogeia fissa]
MSSFQRTLKHTKALIQAFQRPTQVRCFKAPPAVVERFPSVTRDPQCLLFSPKHRWTTTVNLIPRAVTQVPGFDPHPTFSFSTVATPQVDGKDSSTAPSPEPTATPAAEETVEPVQPTDEAEAKGGTEEGAGEDINKEDLVGLLAEKLALLEERNKEIKELKDKLLWSLAEMENVRQRTKRDAESTAKYAVQGFAKALLDVADNLSRATGAVPEGIAKAKPEDDASDNLKVLQTLLLGVQMTEKQLLQVFKKHGLEKYQSLGEQFDPNRHSAVFEVQDPTKSPGTVALELKAGYLLNDRVIRPAEVGVVKAEQS